MKSPIKPLIGPKDPDASRFIWFSARKDVLRASSPLDVSSVTVVEVDQDDVAIVSPTLTFAPPIAEADGMIAVKTSGGIAGQRPYIRCRYALENGETGDATCRLAIAHT